jgi:hypothetical protein
MRAFQQEDEKCTSDVFTLGEKTKEIFSHSSNEKGLLLFFLSLK